MDTAVAFMPDMLDPAECRAFWFRRLHPSGAYCPKCGVQFQRRQAAAFADGGRVHCKACGRWSTYRTGTIFHRTAADDRQLLLLAFMLEVGLPVRVIAEACGLSDDVVRALRHRFGGA